MTGGERAQAAEIARLKEDECVRLVLSSNGNLARAEAAEEKLARMGVQT